MQVTDKRFDTAILLLVRALVHLENCDADCGPGQQLVKEILEFTNGYEYCWSTLKAMGVLCYGMAPAGDDKGLEN